MDAKLIEVMGDDLRVVNAARVSFANESDWEISEHPLIGIVDTLSEKDRKLIKYLATHGHWTPFSHVQITMREKVPIFVARQRFKHMVGFTYNEISRRYVDNPPEFYTPDVWRSRPTGSKKQGSSDETIDIKSVEGPWDYPYTYDDIMYVCKLYYDHLLESGVAPEQARMVLPQSMYTEYYVTGSLAAWSRAYKLRVAPDAQKEIQDLAKQWDTIIKGIPELKYSWEALTSTTS